MPARAIPSGRPPGQFSALLGYWLPPLLWSAAVLAMSGDWGAGRQTLGLVQWLCSWIPSLSPAQIQVIHFYFRKTGHVLAYGILYLLWFRAFQGSFRYRPGISFLWALGLSLLLALLDEGHQSRLASRTGSIRDVALDLGGALLAAGLTGIFRKRPLRSEAAPGTLASGREG
jgi:VanZ family protein